MPCYAIKLTTLEAKDYHDLGETQNQMSLHVTRWVPNKQGMTHVLAISCGSHKREIQWLLPYQAGTSHEPS